MLEDNWNFGHRLQICEANFVHRPMGRIWKFNLCLKQMPNKTMPRSCALLMNWKLGTLMYWPWSFAKRNTQSGDALWDTWSTSPLNGLVHVTCGPFQYIHIKHAGATWFWGFVSQWTIPPTYVSPVSLFNLINWPGPGREDSHFMSINGLQPQVVPEMQSNGARIS